MATGRFVPAGQAVLRGAAANTIELSLVPTEVLQGSTQNLGGEDSEPPANMLVQGYTMQACGRRRWGWRGAGMPVTHGSRTISHLVRVSSAFMSSCLGGFPQGYVGNEYLGESESR